MFSVVFFSVYFSRKINLKKNIYKFFFVNLNIDIDLFRSVGLVSISFVITIMMFCD